MDALHIDTTNEYGDVNRTRWRCYAQGGTSSMPEGCHVGIREFYWFNINWYVIKITEFSPVLGRTWYRQYDKAQNIWSQWVQGS